jgi:hypothetical protein
MAEKCLAEGSVQGWYPYYCISGCVLCTLGWQKGFISSLCERGIQARQRRGRRKDSSDWQWQREYAKRRLRLAERIATASEVHTSSKELKESPWQIIMQRKLWYK